MISVLEIFLRHSNVNNMIKMMIKIIMKMMMKIIMKMMMKIIIMEKKNIKKIYSNIYWIHK